MPQELDALAGSAPGAREGRRALPRHHVDGFLWTVAAWRDGDLVVGFRCAGQPTPPVPDEHWTLAAGGERATPRASTTDWPAAGSRASAAGAPGAG